MIDSLLDYPCVTAQSRASLMRTAPLTPPVTPFQITDDKPSVYQRICDSYCRSHVIGSVSQRWVYQSSCLSFVFESWRRYKIGSVPRAWTMKIVSLQTKKNIFHLATNEKTDQFLLGVKKNTQISTIIAALKSLALIQKELFLPPPNVFILFCWSYRRFYTKWHGFFQKRKILKS